MWGVQRPLGLVGLTRTRWLPVAPATGRCFRETAASALSLLGVWHLNVHPHQTVIGTRERKGFNQRKQRIDTGRPEDRCIGEPWGSGGCAAVRRPAVAAGHAKHSQENCRGNTCRPKDKQSGKKGPAEKSDRPLPGGSGRSGLVAYVAKSQPLLLLLGHKVRVLGQRLKLSGDPESPARVRRGDAVR